MRRRSRVCGLQHVEDFLLLLDVAHQVRLVGMAVLAQHPTVELAAYRFLQSGNAIVQLRSVLRLSGSSLRLNTVFRTAVAGAVLPCLIAGC